MNTEAQNLQEGDFLDYTPAAAKTAGQVISDAGRAGICATAIAALALGSKQVKGVIKVRAAAVTGSKGDIVGWDEDGNPYGDTAGIGAATTNIADVDFLLGSLTEDLTATDGEAQVELNEFGQHTLGVLGSEIYVSPDGNDTFGDGSQARPYKTITAAMAAVIATRKTIIVKPGTYVEPDEVAWPTISGVKLVCLAGQYQTIISTPSADQVISVAPGVQSATFEMWIENLYIDHTVSGQDGIKLDNTSMTKKLNCYLHNVGGDGSASDKFITTTHGDTSNAIRVYWDGDNGGVEGNVYMETKDAGDRLYITGVELSGGLSTSADAVASNVKLTRCTVKHEGVTGGNVAQTITTVCCYSDAPAALDSADLAGSHTEVIVA